MYSREVFCFGTEKTDPQKTLPQGAENAAGSDVSEYVRFSVPKYKCRQVEELAALAGKQALLPRTSEEIRGQYITAPRITQEEEA